MLNAVALNGLLQTFTGHDFHSCSVAACNQPVDNAPVSCGGCVAGICLSQDGRSEETL